jgi:hypothetical protein
MGSVMNHASSQILSAPGTKRAHRSAFVRQALNRVQKELFQQVQFASSVHLALEQFELGNLALNRSLAERQRQGSGHGWIIPLDTLDKPTQLASAALLRPFYPWFEAIKVVVVDDRDECLSQVIDEECALLVTSQLR